MRAQAILGFVSHSLLSSERVRLPDRCVDLTEDHIDDGLQSVERMRSLLTHLARIAKPKEGAAKILVAISRMATTACEWFEGKLYVVVDAMSGASEIAISSDLGGGVRELVFPRLLVGVELEELVNAVRTAPRLVTPLKFRIRGDRMILKRDVDGTVAPPAFEIAEESLRRSLPPALRRSLPPIRPSLPARAAKDDVSVEGALLARIMPIGAKPRPIVIDERAGLDVGWDFGAYSSTVNSRETKPPPPAKTPSRMPTRPPPPSPSKAPPKPSKPSKAPPKPATPAPKGRPMIRKIGDGKKPPKK